MWLVCACLGNRLVLNVITIRFIKNILYYFTGKNAIRQRNQHAYSSSRTVITKYRQHCNFIVNESV